LSKLTAERKEHTTTHVAKVDTTLSPKAWCHSGGSLPAGDGSHSTDQPKGTDVGHTGLSVGFSKVIPEIDTSKAEYSNTQQGLPEFGYALVRN
jgi:hypothetical protein